MLIRQGILFFFLVLSFQTFVAVSQIWRIQNTGRGLTGLLSR